MQMDRQQCQHNDKRLPAIPSNKGTVLQCNTLGQGTKSRRQHRAGRVADWCATRFHSQYTCRGGTAAREARCHVSVPPGVSSTSAHHLNTTLVMPEREPPRICSLAQQQELGAQETDSQDPEVGQGGPFHGESARQGVEGQLSAEIAQDRHLASRKSAQSSRPYPHKNSPLVRLSKGQLISPQAGALAMQLCKDHK